jgi:hypothetical protein
MRLPKDLLTGTPARALPIPAEFAATEGIREAFDMSIDTAQSSAIQPLTPFLARLGHRWPQ